MKLPAFLAIAERTEKVRLLALGLTAAILLAVHLYNCAAAIHQGYLPASSDEIDYVKSVEYFTLNRKAHAFSTFDEIYSPNGNYSFHGPVYTVIFGIPEIVFGSDYRYSIIYILIYSYRFYLYFYY